MADGDGPIDQPDHDFGPTAGAFHQRGELDQIQWVHGVGSVLISLVPLLTDASELVTIDAQAYHHIMHDRGP
jgi:hypothetical protein